MERKVAIITGGSSGIGRALAIEYGRKGYCIVFTGRSPQRVKETSSILNSHAIEHKGLLLDVSSEDDNIEMVEQALIHYGRIDVLICNAGITQRALFEDMDLAVFNKVMSVNFYGAVYGVRYALPHLMKTKGSIIAVSSINGYKGTPARTAYSASKFAMQGFFDSLRMELKPRGVHVLVVNPGFTATNIRKTALTANGHEQGESPRDETKMMTAEEVATRVYNAAERKERDLILTSLGKATVALNKWFPGWVDGQAMKLMAKENASPIKVET